MAFKNRKTTAFLKILNTKVWIIYSESYKYKGNDSVCLFGYSPLLIAPDFPIRPAATSRARWWMLIHVPDGGNSEDLFTGSRLPHLHITPTLEKSRLSVISPSCCPGTLVPASPPLPSPAPPVSHQSNQVNPALTPGKQPINISLVSEPVCAIHQCPATPFKAIH